MARDGIFTEEEVKDWGEEFRQVTGTNLTAPDGTPKRVLDINVLGLGGSTASPTNSAIQIDPDTTAGTTYYGWAVIGTATSAASWKIMRKTTTGCASAFTWADSNDSFDNVWDNRASLSYG